MRISNFLVYNLHGDIYYKFFETITIDKRQLCIKVEIFHVDVIVLEINFLRSKCVLNKLINVYEVESF